MHFNAVGRKPHAYGAETTLIPFCAAAYGYMVCSGKGRKGHKGDGQGRPGVTCPSQGYKK